MSPGATFERVYQALKEQLGSPRYAAGQSLEPAALSHELNASITPVRDALHRLVGEGLVEAPRGDGFRTPPVTEVGLRHLYRWNAALLGLAVRSGAAETANPGTPAVAEPIESIEHVFAAIAAGTGNPEHLAAILRLNERLRPIRRVELDLLSGLDEEIAAIAGQFAERATGELRRSITRFHRRRERLVAQIVAALVTAR